MDTAPRSACATLIALALWALGAANLAAFTMEPMVATVTPSGDGSIATFRFRNDGAEPAAIRVKVLTRALGPDGAEVNGPADGLFEIFPERVVIQAGAVAAVKLRWKGPAKVDRELSFRFVAEQVPVDFGASGGSGIKVLFRYVASLYVGDPSFKPAISVAAKPSLGPDGAAGFSVEVGNQGNRHAVVLGLSVELGLGDGSVVTLSAADLKALSDLNYLPGTSRRIFIPDARAIPGGTCDVRSSFDTED